jgi:hypothetical protein
LLPRLNTENNAWPQIEWELSRINDPWGINGGEFEEEMGFVSDSNVDSDEEENDELAASF